jgi:hypothetical protein
MPLMPSEYFPPVSMPLMPSEFSGLITPSEFLPPAITQMRPSEFFLPETSPWMPFQDFPPVIDPQSQTMLPYNDVWPENSLSASSSDISPPLLFRRRRHRTSSVSVLSIPNKFLVSFVFAYFTVYKTLHLHCMLSVS